MSNYTPQPSDKFTFGLWTVGNVGRDPFGEAVREPVDPADSVRKLAPLGAYGVNFHDNDLIPFGASASEREAILKKFKAALADTGMKVPMATTNLFSHPVFKDGAFTSSDPKVRAFAIQKAMRGMDLGKEVDAETYVFWGGREGSEVDAAKNPLDTLKWMREALNFLNAYQMEQGYDYKLCIEPKPNEPRGDIYLATTGPRFGLHRNPRSSRKRRRQSRIRARHNGRFELRPQRRASYRCGQVVSRRFERSEAGPLRSGFALWSGRPENQFLSGETARRQRLSRPETFRRPRAAHIRRRRCVGICQRLYAHVFDSSKKKCSSLTLMKKFKA